MAVCKEAIITVRGVKVKLFRGGAGAPLLFLHDEFCPAWLPIHDMLTARTGAIRVAVTRQSAVTALS